MLAVICKHKVSVLHLVNLFLSISAGPAVNYMLTCPVVLCFFSYKLNHPKLHDGVGVQGGLMSVMFSTRIGLKSPVSSSVTTFLMLSWYDRSSN